MYRRLIQLAKKRVHTTQECEFEFWLKYEDLVDI